MRAAGASPLSASASSTDAPNGAIICAARAAQPQSWPPSRPAASRRPESSTHGASSRPAHGHPGGLGRRQELLARHVAPLPAPAGHRLGADDAGAGQVGDGPVLQHQLGSTRLGGAGLVLTGPGLAGAGRTRVGLTRVGLARLCLTRLGRSQPGLAVLIRPGWPGPRARPSCAARLRCRRASGCGTAGKTSSRPPPDSLARDTAASALRQTYPAGLPSASATPTLADRIHAAVGGAEWFGGHAGQDALGQLDDLPGRGGFGDQDREHVAAPAGHRAARRHHGPQPPPHLGQNQISRAGTGGVVHAGERVQVDQDDPGYARALPLQAEYLAGPLFQVGAVGQPGQPVVIGQVRDLAAQRHLVADVPRRDQQPVGGALAPVPRDGRLHVPPGPVGRPDPAGVADLLARSIGHRSARHRRGLTDRTQPA